MDAFISNRNKETYRVEGDVKVGQRLGWRVYKPKNVSTSQMLPATARGRREARNGCSLSLHNTARLRAP